MAGSSLTVLLLAATLGGAAAFLATSLNTSDPDVARILCPEQTEGVTRDHKWITREAIRRNLRQFFMDNPPLSEPDFYVPPTATLTELYHAYYGTASSSARFIKAVNSITAANVKADSATQLRHDPDIQGDGEDLASLQATLVDRYPQIQTSILVAEAYPAARSLLGLSLHSLQKFYAHSTWIEQGHKDILPDLGLPGFAFDNLAGTNEDVCNACPSPEGCSGNVIVDAGLSSGYYHYDDPSANHYLLPKPHTGGKCSHGGVLDDSSSVPAQGGVNKDTASPCFSPHHHLHQQAAELAVQATDHYLSVLLDAVGNEKYRRLFDLYQGSALSIMIDTTGSMTDDIEAVKEQVKTIVENFNPELYVLAPYNDPYWGPGMRTHNSSEFLKAVNALHAGGGNASPEEMFWSGLQLALSLTPNYGDIFCFTDAGGRDGNKMESSIARTQLQHNKVSVIYSGIIRNHVSGLGDVLTEVQEYRRLADSTGGLFIPSDKFSIDTIMPILVEGVESSNVDITQLKEMTGPQHVQLPIDDSVHDFEIHLTGETTTALLKDMTGTEYDLMDQAALETDPKVEIVVYSNGLKAIRWKDPLYGQWSLHTDSVSTYSIAVSANSTLSFLGGFSVLDPSPPHPHYRAAEGNPLINTVYYLDVTLIGYLENDVIDVSKVEYVDKAGTKLREILYHGDVDDEFYIRSEPLPEQPFYVKLFGHVHSGNVFCRLLSVLITPVETKVGVLATSEDLAARPGYSANADFLITNYGLSSYFHITGIDDMGFLKYLETDRMYITHNSSKTLAAHFDVPRSSVPGTVSMVTITAQSEEQTQSVNSAISQFVVLPERKDVDPPTCVLASQPDCTGYDLNGLCSHNNWTTQATLQDDFSGLVNVYARPVGLSTSVEGLKPGTKGEVVLTYWASCCTSQVEIIGVDSSGNVGKCIVDMGTVGGMVVDLEAVSVGVTWVELKWSITPTNYEVHKFSLLINDDFSVDMRCMETVCFYNATYLDPCSLQTFRLTPHFYVRGVDQIGQPATTQATTADEDPGTPINGVVLSASVDTANITWEAPNTKCFSYFKVCYRPFGFYAEKVCEKTSSTNYLMRGLEACAVYEITVTSIGPSGDESKDSLVFSINTQETDTITITFDDPLNHAQCANLYNVDYRKTNQTLQVDEVMTAGRQETALVGKVSDSDNIVTISDLDPCTNYTIFVAAVSFSGFMGPYAERKTATNETARRSRVTSVWIPPTARRPLQTFCRVSNTSSYSPSGHHSNVTWQTHSTLELAPGEPQNLTVVKATPHTVDVKFDPPVINPQCIAEYNYDIYFLDNNELREEGGQGSHSLENVFENLDACTTYMMKVRAVSRGQLASDWVTTRTTTTEDDPSEPRLFVLQEATETSLEVTWWAPELNSKCVSSYYLEWTTPDGNTDSDTITPPPGEVLPFVVDKLITGLKSCTTYTLKVSTKTPLGSSGPIASLSASTLC
ncbi:von Willebrand factor A domain-containing protein 7-like 1 [Homarus americanus]|uniref:von Willebrand factor A domain-containing protein 7-like 1 n=1 Tax=Homarus americanus TaxID=6706 RepID=A0A8J5JT37_HOMAM|nr:von Willebrand factor A domain-containing protein 7-like 1 [Homarus americanus]